MGGDKTKYIGRIYVGCLEPVDNETAGRIKLLNFFNLIAEKSHTVGCIVVGQANIYRIAADAKGSPFKLNLIAGIQTVDQPAEKLITPNLLSYVDNDDVFMKIVGITDTI